MIFGDLKLDDRFVFLESTYVLHANSPYVKEYSLPNGTPANRWQYLTHEGMGEPYMFAVPDNEELRNLPVRKEETMLISDLDIGDLFCFLNPPKYPGLSEKETYCLEHRSKSHVRFRDKLSLHTVTIHSLVSKVPIRRAAQYPQILKYLKPAISLRKTEVGDKFRFPKGHHHDTRINTEDVFQRAQSYEKPLFTLRNIQADESWVYSWDDSVIDLNVHLVTSVEVDTCIDCNGSGKYHGLMAVEECSLCKGKGTV